MQFVVQFAWRFRMTISHALTNVCTSLELLTNSSRLRSLVHVNSINTSNINPFHCKMTSTRRLRMSSTVYSPALNYWQSMSRLWPLSVVKLPSAIYAFCCRTTSFYWLRMVLMRDKPIKWQKTIQEPSHAAASLANTSQLLWWIWALTLWLSPWDLGPDWVFFFDTKAWNIEILRFSTTSSGFQSSPDSALHASQKLLGLMTISQDAYAFL